MAELSAAVFRVIGVLMLVGFGVFGIASMREKEKRAARIAFVLAATGLLLVAAYAAPAAVRVALLAAVSFAAVVFFVASILPIGRAEPERNEPRTRFDERDIMFARARLEPETREFESYYSLRPENRDGDDLFRTRPGLLSPKASAADPFLFASAHAGSDLIEVLRKAVNSPVSEERHSLPPARMTAFLKALALYYGALRAGVTELRPYHVYSHIGRGTGRYGDPIEVDHRYAIAFTVEMDFHMIAVNPAAPGIVESLRQYVESARVAVQLTNAIHRLGHAARAHIDGNYRVIAPLVARDAGLGEIGRMGLLMTHRWGPRCASVS